MRLISAVTCAPLVCVSLTCTSLTCTSLGTISLGTHSTTAWATDPDPDPVYSGGARTVDMRNTSGGISRYTSIPSNSLFATTGGAGSSCTYIAQHDGYTYDGHPVQQGQLVHSTRWLFEEAPIVSFGEGIVISPVISSGRIRDAIRTFMVFCDSREHLLQYLVVWPSDPMLNPHSRLDRLYNALQLDVPRVWQNPVVDRWGGLVTRYPAWLAIHASAWRHQQSNPQRWRGWLLYLYTVPLAMDFHVVFTPDPARPSPAFDGYVPCVDRGTAPVGDGNSMPAFPDLPDHAAPGVNWWCMWTPPGPGTVTIQARITYDVLFWANGFTEELPEYQWSSPSAQFAVGELAVVNVRD